MIVQKAQEFIQNSLHVVKEIFKDIDQNYPGHTMVTMVVAFGPYYTAPHISAIKSGEKDIPISDCRYFGDMAFCCKWQQNTKKAGIETTHEEIQCLFLGIDPRNSSTESTINISAELPIGKAIAKWESQPRVKLWIRKCTCAHHPTEQ